jgi:hypothetical protein
VLVHARDVDDPAPAATGDHPAGRALGAQERTVEVRREHLAPRLVAEVEDPVHVPGSGVVDQNTQPAELLGERVDDVGGVRTGQILADDEAALAALLDPLPGVPGAGVVGMERDAHVESFRRQRLGRGFADSGIGTGDDREPLVCGNAHARRVPTRRAPTRHRWSAGGRLE